MDLLETWLLNQGLQFQLNSVFLSLLDIVLFGVLGSLLSAVFGLPDILENIKAFATTACDGIQLLLFPTGQTHVKRK